MNLQIGQKERQEPAKRQLKDAIIEKKDKIVGNMTGLWKKFNSSQEKNEESDEKSWEKKKTFGFSNIAIIRGSLIGVTISALLRWNSGRYNRLSYAFRQLRFTRNLIVANQKPVKNFTELTNYYVPNLQNPMNNFICFSGEAGVGKSSHFQNLAYKNSGIRPVLYLSFKASGKDQTFKEDLAEQVGYGTDCPGVLSEIIRAVRHIHDINTKPHKLWWEVATVNSIFIGTCYSLFMSSLQASLGLSLFSFFGISYIFYMNFMTPFIIQSFRKTCPLLIFDDLNKMQQMNMLPEIVRYLQLLQNGMANVILISSDEQTWSKLRREPGMKDRLRLRHINYDHILTAQKLIILLNEQKNYDIFMKQISGSQLYDRKVVIGLIKELIGKRQVTLRRFVSLLKLNDQEEYEKLTQILKSYKNEEIKTSQAIQKFTDILFDSQMETMVANIKNIKRSMKISEDNFFLDLKILLKKGKLPSDNVLASHLKTYNIVRDLRSEYVINGKFMHIVLSMAILQYQKDMKQFQQDIKNGSSSLPSEEFLIKSQISSRQNALQAQNRKLENQEQKS